MLLRSHARDVLVNDVEIIYFYGEVCPFFHSRILPLPISVRFPNRVHDMSIGHLVIALKSTQFGSVKEVGRAPFGGSRLLQQLHLSDLHSTRDSWQMPRQGGRNHQSSGKFDYVIETHGSSLGSGPLKGEFFGN
jgi:hypothetical protein